MLQPVIPNMPANVALKMDLADQLNWQRLLCLEYQYIQVLAHLAIDTFAHSLGDLFSYSVFLWTPYLPLYHEQMQAVRNPVEFESW